MFHGCTVQSKFPVLYNHRKDGISTKISDVVVSRFAMALPKLFPLFAQSSRSVSVGGTDMSVLASDRGSTDTVRDCWQGEMFAWYHVEGMWYTGFPCFVYSSRCNPGLSVIPRDLKMQFCM